MNNQFISIGIDLGTTNSSIVANIDGKIEIIKKPGGIAYTPSVFGFDKSGNRIVGKKAYEYLYKYGKIKRQSAQCNQADYFQKQTGKSGRGPGGTVSKRI